MVTLTIEGYKRKTMSTTLVKKFWPCSSEFNYLEKNSSDSSVALFCGTKWNGIYSWGSQSIWEVLLMDVIRQVGTVSECICNGIFILLTEVMWYRFIRAQVQLMQLAKFKAMWEAETPSQDHPYSRRKRKSSSAPSQIPRPPGFSAFLFPLHCSPGAPPGNTAPLPVPTAAPFCLVG